MDRTLGVQVLTQLVGLASIPTDHLPTAILEHQEILGQRNTLSTLLETALDTTRMDLVEKEEEWTTEARNKSRCLLVPDLLTDRWTLPLSPLISFSSLLSTVCGLVERVARPYTRMAHIPASRSSCPSASRLARGHFPPYSGLSFDLPSFACSYPLSICCSNLVLMPPVLSLQPNKVYIGGLPEHTRKEDLESCFGKIGAILNVELKYVCRAHFLPVANSRTIDLVTASSSSRAGKLPRRASPSTTKGSSWETKFESNSLTAVGGPQSTMVNLVPASNADSRATGRGSLVLVLEVPRS